MKTVEIRIAPDGSITAKTQGYIGKSCMDAMPILELLCSGLVVESGFLQETEEQAESHTYNKLGDITCRT